MAKTTDPIFLEFERTAPRLDLRFYLASVARRNPATLGPTTPIAIADMVELYRELCGARPGSPASQKRRAWKAIDAYKASLPGTPGAGLPRAYDAEGAEIDGPETWTAGGEWTELALDDADLLARVINVATRLAAMLTSSAEPVYQPSDCHAPGIGALAARVEAELREGQIGGGL